MLYTTFCTGTEGVYIAQHKQDIGTAQIFDYIQSKIKMTNMKLTCNVTVY